MTENDTFERAIERLLADESPRREVQRLSVEDQSLIMMAQRLRGNSASGPSSVFREKLRMQIAPKVETETRKVGVSRRQAFARGIGTLAAGLAAGFGVERLVQSTNVVTTLQAEVPLVGKTGRWIPVAAIHEVLPGGARPFNTGAIQGYLFNDNGKIRAMSRICTHMGCVLNYADGSDMYGSGEQMLVCPCHGAEFNLAGRLISKYHTSQPLPPLPKIDVRVNGDSVEVWGV